MRQAAFSAFFVLLLTLAAFSNPSHTQADFEKKATSLRSKLDGRGFTVIIERPFVVIGDDSKENVAAWATESIRGTVKRLKLDYFKKDPDNILEIWLFKDKTSYEKHAKEFFNDEPDTPYGYYSPSKKALIMNISTGGGTLVHEIVHPFVEANFPDCAAWFNEGLGSLYEQSGTKNGHIYGYTNWRLAGFQRAIRDKAVPTFATLTSTTERQFYNEDRGTNYAQARYLCYYLQERKLLVKFYRSFTANSKTDPTGYKTLEKTLGVRDMKAFQKKWENYVSKLVY